MFKKLRRAFLEYIRENSGIYTAVTIFFLAGLVSGAIVVRFLDETQLVELGTAVSGFLEGLKSGANEVLMPLALLKSSLQKNTLFIIIVWVLGFLWMGFPLVLAAVAVKGFALGFTVAFIVSRSSLKGLVFCLAALLPHNLLLVPAYILATAAALTLSLLKFKDRLGKRRINRSKYYRDYCYFMALIFILILFGAFVEAYITPVFMRLAASVI